jgi:hypothetical protein
MSSSNTRFAKLPSAMAALSLAAAFAISPLNAEVAGAQSRNPKGVDVQTGAGIYFPAIASTDNPEIRFSPMANSGPQQRQTFVDQINLAAIGAEQPLPIIFQAVGADRKTLVVTNIETDEPMTAYIARAMLARITSVTRFLPAIQEMGLSSEFDIYNMGAVLGFERIVVTDGRRFAHEAQLTGASSEH